MEIKNVIICGLGALGLTYANKLKNVCNLKILANKERVEKYKENLPTLNNIPIKLDYILPEENWDTDLIIISTKTTGLDSALEYIKNFVNKNTVIISLINGISSEEKIASIYGKENIVKSYFIGHSAMRKENNVLQDGIGKIVLEPNQKLETFFKNHNIDYEICENIQYSMWLKLGVNIILNQPSAIYKMTVGELRNLPEYYPLAKKLLNEVADVAKVVGIKNIDNYEEEVLESIKLIADDGKTSMLQDILAQRKTEVDIFSGEIIKLGKIYGIKTPYNEDIYNKIKSIERDFS